MLHNLKRILKYNLEDIREITKRNKKGSENGLTVKEYRRISEMFPFQKDFANFCGHKFYFSDPNGFLHSVEEIFQEKVYHFNCLSEIPYIIDCGANFGVSIYYFKKIFPKAEILAFEPDAVIFNILNDNVTELGDNENITLHNKAAWTENTSLDFFSDGSLAGSVSIDFLNKHEVTKVLAIDLKQFLTRKVDFLKMDIEGAEHCVLFDIQHLLHNVEMLFLEYHEILGKPQNLSDILNVIREAGFSYYIKLAADNINLPFVFKGNFESGFGQQLNIFCYRK